MRGSWHSIRPHSRRDRRPRRVGPVVEALEDRLVLAGTSPANVVPIGPQTSGTLTPQQLGAAYQQVVVIQTATLQSLGDSYREAQTAGARFASRATGAIDKLNAELRQSESQHNANAIAAAIRRDRQLLNLGGADVASVEQGLDVARGLADQQANTDKIYIPNRLILTTLAELVQQDQSTGTAISRSGRRSVNALVRELNKLGDQLVSTIRVRPSVKD
jgi:hypothetical protein